MPAKSHSRAVKLSATFLAKLAGVDTAASLFNVDRRTVRGWLGSVEVPEDHWSAIEATLLARGAEMTAKGETRGLVPTLTGAGIASRNRRYQALIAQREARRQATAAEQPERSPTQQQTDRLADLRQRLLASEINLTLDEATGTQKEQREDDPAKFLAWLTEYVDALLAMSDEEVEQATKEVGDALQELQDQRVGKWRAEPEAARAAQTAREAAAAAERSQPAADSPRTPEAPARPSLRVVDDPPGAWQPYGRWEIR